MRVYRPVLQSGFDSNDSLTGCVQVHVGRIRLLAAVRRRKGAWRCDESFALVDFDGVGHRLLPGLAYASDTLIAEGVADGLSVVFAQAKKVALRH